MSTCTNTAATGAGFPVAAKKYKQLNIPPKIFFACKHFGTGVLIATAFVHVSTLLDARSQKQRLKALGSCSLQHLETC